MNSRHSSSDEEDRRVPISVAPMPNSPKKGLVDKVLDPQQAVSNAVRALRPGFSSPAIRAMLAVHILTMLYGVLVFCNLAGSC